VNLELVILRQLEAAHPRMVKESVLVAEVHMEAEGESKTSIERSIRVLEGKGQLRIYPGEDVTRIAITDEGLHRLDQAR